MRQRVQRFDWSLTTLGARDSWPQHYHTALSECLDAPVPVTIWLGVDLVVCYNDAWDVRLGSRYAHRFGQPGARGFADLWQTIGAPLRAVYASARATFCHGVEMPVGRAETCPFSWYINPLYDPAGQVAGLITALAEPVPPVMVRPTPVGTQSEEALAHSVARFRRIVESRLVGVLFTDTQGRITDANAALLELLGYERSELIGMAWSTITPPEHAAADAAATAQLITTGSVAPYAKTYFRKDGSRVPVLVGATILETDPVAGGSEAVAFVIDNAVAYYSEARYRSLVEASAQVVWRATPDGRLSERRTRWSTMTGIAPDDLPEDPFDLIHPDDLAQGSAAWQFALDHTTPLGFVQRVRGNDGQYRTWQVRTAPVLEADGRVREWVGTDTDITARMAAEQALRESELQLRLITDSMPALISYVDSQQRYQFVNKTYSEWFGYQRDEVIGRYLWDMLGEAAYAVVQSEIDQALTGHEVTFERMIPYRHGARFMQATYIPDRAADGEVRGYFALAIDLTERQQAEDQLRYQTRLFESLTASVLDGILIVSPEGQMLHVNQQFADIWHFPPDVIASQSDARALAWAANQTTDPAGFLARVTAVYGQPDFQVREEVAMRDGRVYERFGAPIRDGDVRLGWLWTFRDISERKQAEREREQLLVHEQELRRQAEEASRLKDEFLATVSHELRTPLTAFLGYAQLLQSRKRDEAYIARSVEKMIRSAKVQAQLIEDLLDISRSVSGRLRIDLTPLDLRDVVRAALDTVRPAADARQLTLLNEIDPAPVRVVGDANRLQQVVWNLLANAVKFTPSAGVVIVRIESDQHDALLTVSDTGQGISAAFLPYVFDRFRQADSKPNRSNGGLGIGLAIVRHLVELHGGTVHVQSAGIDQGATFHVRLPLITGGVVPQTDARAEPERVTGFDTTDCPPELVGLRLLVVDDQPEIMELLAEMLSSCGADVRSCAGAQEALAIIRDWQPQVLVSDIAMPGEDGYWLIEQVRALPAEAGGTIPAIALTAYVRMEDRLRILAAGFEQYVPKPVEAAELRAVVAHLARGAAAATGESPTQADQDSHT